MIWQFSIAIYLANNWKGCSCLLLIFSECQRRLRKKPRFPVIFHFSPQSNLGNPCKNEEIPNEIPPKTPIFFIGLPLIFQHKSIPSRKELGSALEICTSRDVQDHLIGFLFPWLSILSYFFNCGAVSLSLSLSLSLSVYGIYICMYIYIYRVCMYVCNAMWCDVMLCNVM